MLKSHILNILESSVVQIEAELAVILHSWWKITFTTQTECTQVLKFEQAFGHGAGGGGRQEMSLSRKSPPLPEDHSLQFRGVSRRSQTGGPSESLILAPWSKVEEWRPHHQFWHPWSFLPWSPSGAPLLVLEWRPIRHVALSFSFFLSFPLFSSFSFPFFFWRPFSNPGVEVPKAPPVYALVYWPTH